MHYTFLLKDYKISLGLKQLHLVRLVLIFLVR